MSNLCKILDFYGVEENVLFIFIVGFITYVVLVTNIFDHI